MAALTTIAQFEIRYGQNITGDDINRVSALIDDASAIVLDVADLTTDWTAATLPAVVLPVLCEVVRRAFDNPSGLSGETIGDYTWRGGAASSGVYLTTEEKRTVRRAASKLGVVSLDLSNDLPLTTLDPRYTSYANDEGVIIVNAAEPVDY